jgi:hypothetical protein
MNVLLSWLIVAVAGAAPIESPGAAHAAPPAHAPAAAQHASTVYYCGFEEESDDDFDGWPQGWQRRRGPAYPHYLEVKISQEQSFAGDYCFRMNLNGGAAAASCPPQPYDPGSEYVAEVQVKTIALKHDRAFLALRFLDDKQQVVHSEISRHDRQNDVWRKVRIGPVFCDKPEVKFVSVELHLEPGERQDLRGAALFDELRLDRLPRKNVRGKRPFNVFPIGEPVELSLTLTGVSEPKLRAKLELFDRGGRSVSVDEQVSVLDPKEPLAPRTVVWKPKITEPGYYRGEVSLFGAEGLMQRDATSLVIVEPLAKLGDPAAGIGEFGWSITEAAHVPRSDQLHALLYETGVRRLKYPVWFDAKKPESGASLKKFIDRLNVQGVAIVGTLTPRTQEIDTRFMPQEISAAQTFRLERDKWFPTIEPVMLDLAFKVRGWQLGDDRDFGFQELPGAADRIAAVKKEFDRIEQDAQVGVAWSWLTEHVQETRPAWRYLALTASPDLTAEETKQYMALAEQPGVERWLSMSALSTEEYTIEDRVRDLVDRVVAAKTAGAQGVFYLDPFHSETGLIERSGAPTEIYLPWRTLTALIDGARPMPAARLPGGSRNQLFLRQQDVAMLLSNDVPTTETADLEGDVVRFFDLWGRAITPRKQGDGNVVDVGPVPIVAVGLDRDTFIWDAACKLDQPQLRESFGVGQPCSVTITNTFKQTVQGKISIVAPSGWVIRPATFDVSLAEGEKLRLPFQVVLPLSATSGQELLKIEHDLASDKRRQFHLYREIQIGDNSVVLEVDTKFVGDELEVEQRLTNNSQKNVSFRCFLYAPNQRRMRAQVVELPPGIDIRTFRVPDGRTLIGKTLWLRAEEQNGTRVLSNRFTVKDDG